MATLTHGPRLGAPASDGFKVWARATNTPSVSILCDDTTGWIFIAPTGGTLTIDAGVKFEGAGSVKLTRTIDTTALYGATNTFTLTPGVTYRLRVYASSATANATDIVRVLLYNQTQGKQLRSTDLTWVAPIAGEQAIKGTPPASGAFYPFDVSFTVPANFGVADVWYMELHHNNSTVGASSAVYYDNITITPGNSTAVLNTRLSGTAAWTTGSPVAIDVSRDETVVLTASGLLSRTSYDYRVDIDGVPGTVYTTITMPPSTGGRFVVYQTTDCHDGSTATGSVSDCKTIYTNILAHYNANYAPSGIPGFIVQYGDIFTGNGSNQNTESWAASFMRPSLANIDVSGAGRALPILYMWDDWDYAGNNSVGATTSFFAGSADVLHVYDNYWRDAGQPAPPSRGFVFDVAGVPFVVTDQRSQRAPSQRTAPSNASFRWQDPAGTDNTAFGAAQLAWLKTTLASYGSRALVVLVCGTTFKNSVHEQRSPYAAGGIRDSVGIYYIAERNALLSHIAGRGYAWRNNLVIWSGDDHWNVVWKDVQRDNISPGDTLLPVAGHYPAAPASVAVPFLEFKVNGNAEVDSRNAGNSPILFGAGNLYSRDTLTQAPTSDLHSTFLLWDIVSAQGGEHVAARIKYVVSTCSTAAHATFATETDDLGRAGDFYFEDGTFAAYSATLTAAAQRYPVENGQSGPTFRRWFVDDINGHMIPEDGVVRDDEQRLRDTRDTGETDRDILLRYWRPRREQQSQEP